MKTMKTLREIQDDVSKKFGYHWSINLQKDYKDGVVSENFYNDYLQDCFIEIQRQQQHIINKRVEDYYLNDNFDTSSIINENNIIR